MTLFGKREAKLSQEIGLVNLNEKVNVRGQQDLRRGGQEGCNGDERVTQTAQSHSNAEQSCACGVRGRRGGRRRVVRCLRLCPTYRHQPLLTAAAAAEAIPICDGDDASGKTAKSKFSAIRFWARGMMRQKPPFIPSFLRGGRAVR